MKKKTDWTRFLEEQQRSPIFREAFERESRALQIGLALARRRNELQLSQQAIAERMGTSAPQVSRTENTPEHANLQTLLRYAQAVGMDLEFVLTPKAARKERGKKGRSHIAARA